MNKHNKTFQLDNKLVKKNFACAAKDYDQHAILQSETGNHLLQRLELIKLHPQIIVNLGSTTGHFSTLLKKKFPQTEIISIEIAANMHQVAKQKDLLGEKSHFITADWQHLPIASQSVDLIFSNLGLHWQTADISAVLVECQRILNPHGLFLFSTLGPDTLKELRTAWAEIDSYAHVHAFLDMHDIGDILLEAGFADPVMDRDYIYFHYNSLEKLFADLKAVGASNASLQRRRGLTTPNIKQHVINNYIALNNNAEKFTATFEIIYAQTWGISLQKTKKMSRSNEFYIPLTEIKKQI